MLVRPTFVASCLLPVALATGCLNKRQQLEEIPPPTLFQDPVVLEVENHNWADVILYILHDGVRTRFTQVAAAHKVSVEIPAELQGQMGIIRVSARRIGGTDSYVSEAISLRGSSAVRLTIESSLGRSSIGVW
jgi:hypothetical protein